MKSVELADEFLTLPQINDGIRRYTMGLPPKPGPNRKKKGYSARAAAVAQEVIEATIEGRKVNKRAIKRKYGYAENSVAVNRVEATHTYQETIMNFIEKMQYIREEVVHAMQEKDYSKVEAEKLSTIMKNLTHDIQLLSGGKTDNVGIDEDRMVIHTILKEIRSDVQEALPNPHDGERVPELPEATASL